MANASRGEVDLVVGAKTYVLRISINAMCDMEAVLGAKAQAIIAEFRPGEAASLTTVRGVLWGALREHHDDTSLLAAGQIIEDLGYGAAYDKVVAALMLFLPKPEAAGPP